MQWEKIPERSSAGRAVHQSHLSALHTPGASRAQNLQLISSQAGGQGAGISLRGTPGFRNTRMQAEVRLAVPQALWGAGTHTLHSVTALPAPGSRLGTQQALATPASVATQAGLHSTK